MYVRPLREPSGKQDGAHVVVDLSRCRCVRRACARWVGRDGQPGQGTSVPLYMCMYPDDPALRWSVWTSHERRSGRRPAVEAESNQCICVSLSVVCCLAGRQSSTIRNMTQHPPAHTQHLLTLPPLLPSLSTGHSRQGRHRPRRAPPSHTPTPSLQPHRRIELANGRRNDHPRTRRRRARGSLRSRPSRLQRHDRDGCLYQW